MNKRFPVIGLLLAAATFGANAGQAAAPATPAVGGSPQQRDLQNCLALAQRDPPAGEARAREWAGAGGDYARLCLAMAAYHGGRFEPAARALEELVPTLGGADPRTAANLLMRAGWAWLRAGDVGKADRAYSQALERQPDDIDLLIDRAFARNEAKHYPDAVADLTAALRKDPKRADAYFYRAGALRSMRDLAGAEKDINRSLQLHPDNPDALLLRGNLRALRNDAAGAAADWQKVVRLAPESDSGRQAAALLDKLKATPGREKPGAPPKKP